MVDFSASFQRGLAAASLARKNRDEIKQIFDQFNQALSEMTAGKVKVAIVPTEETMNPLARLVGSFSKAVSDQHSIAICATGESKLIPKHLARWIQGDEGYPCTLIWGNTQATCHDAESLTLELEALFSSATAGEAIVSARDGTSEPVKPPGYW